MNEITIGIDISKDHLDVHVLPDGVATQFPNTPLGFRALARHLAGHHVARLVYEPTGPYHGAFERAVANHLPLVKSPPPRRRGATLCRPAVLPRRADPAPKRMQ